MKKIYWLITIVVMICAPMAAAEQSTESFVSLFNGKNLDGWVNINCAPQTWQVEDGIIVCSGIPTGLLRTEKQYENFILELDWRHTRKAGNAGVFIHSAALPAPGQPFTRAIEIQVEEGNGGDVFAIHGATMTTDNKKPITWMRSFPSENRTKPAGQWNHYRIISKAGTVNLEVNGKRVTRGFDCNPRKGYICLESEGSLVHFKNIRIKEMPSSNPAPELIAEKARGFRPLYNGLNLDGLKQTMGDKGHWIAKDHILEYDGKSAEPEKYKNHIQTEEEFKNFTLLVDWRLMKEPVINDETLIILPDGSYALDEQGEQIKIKIFDAGDSGVFLRGSGKYQVNIWSWPVGSGEFWGIRNDKSMSPEVRKGVTPILWADKLPGKWNRFEITLIGDRVSVELNGKTVIREAKLPGIPEQGPIVFQNHTDPIQFTNFYIKELD